LRRRICRKTHEKFFFENSDKDGKPVLIQVFHVLHDEDFVKVELIYKQTPESDKPLRKQITTSEQASEVPMVLCHCCCWVSILSSDSESAFKFLARILLGASSKQPSLLQVGKNKRCIIS